jgi:hypothetical protein
MDLSRRGFAIENEWYWRITENAQSFDAEAAVRDFLVPLARLAKDVIAITELTSDSSTIRFVLGTEPITIQLAPGAQDRVALNHLVGDVNRLLAPSKHAFAVVSPRRYELRGVLLTEDEFAQLVGRAALLIPSGRPSWRSIPTPTG